MKKKLAAIAAAGGAGALVFVAAAGLAETAPAQLAGGNCPAAAVSTAHVAVWGPLVIPGVYCHT
jgi:hypothetical protein